MLSRTPSLKPNAPAPALACNEAIPCLFTQRLATVCLALMANVCAHALELVQECITIAAELLEIEFYDFFAFL